jgi:gas vesicle protein
MCFGAYLSGTFSFFGTVLLDENDFISKFVTTIGNIGFGVFVAFVIFNLQYLISKVNNKQFLNTIDNLKNEINSNINSFKNEIGKEFNNQLNSICKRIESNIETFLKDDRTELEQKIQELNDKINSYLEEIEGKLNEIHMSVKCTTKNY